MLGGGGGGEGKGMGKGVRRGCVGCSGEGGGVEGSEGAGEGGGGGDGSGEDGDGGVGEGGGDSTVNEVFTSAAIVGREYEFVSQFESVAIAVRSSLMLAVSVPRYAQLLL